MDAGQFLLLADYESLGWIVLAVLTAAIGGSLLVGFVAAGLLAIVTRDRRQLWWTPVFAAVALGLLALAVYLAQ